MRLLFRRRSRRGRPLLLPLIEPLLLLLFLLRRSLLYWRRRPHQGMCGRWSHRPGRILVLSRSSVLSWYSSALSRLISVFSGRSSLLLKCSRLRVRHCRTWELFEFGLEFGGVKERNPD
jgi:hypothetical protein